MTPTLNTFIRALMAPDLALTTLAAARAVPGGDGRPLLRRTTRFAEAEIEWQGSRYLLMLPLNEAAIPAAERALNAIGPLAEAAWLTRYRILPEELRWQDPAGEERRCDLVLHPLPTGCDFDEALLRVPSARLGEALRGLQTAMAAARIRHRDLCAANLRWCQDAWVLLRSYDACIGAEQSGAFDALHRHLAEAAEAQVRDTTATYDPAPAPTGYLWTGNRFEGLRCVQDKQGYGFVDNVNRLVIPTQYRWAGDFHEGRAEVETAEGMGLIDREGNYVLPPHFEIVDYDAPRSIVRARRDGRWEYYDYLGQPIREAVAEPVR